MFFAYCVLFHCYFPCNNFPSRMNGFSKTSINKYESVNTMTSKPMLLISCGDEKWLEDWHFFNQSTGNSILTRVRKSKWIGASHIITPNIMHNGLIKYAVYDMRLYGSRHFALSTRLTMPPRPQAQATMNHAIPSDQAVFPRPV